MTCRMIGVEGVEKGYFTNDYLPNDFSQRVDGIPKGRRNPVSPLTVARNVKLQVETDLERSGIKLSRAEKLRVLRTELKGAEPRMMMYSGYGKGSVM